MDYGEVRGQAPRLQKKPSINQGSGNLGGVGKDAAFYAVQQTRDKCEQMFNTLKCHPAIPMFLAPPDITNPRYKQVETEMPFMNLTRIEIKLRNNEYSTTFQLGKDMRQMFLFFQKYHINDPKEIESAKQLQTYFDNLFLNLDLENKPLIASTAPTVQAFEGTTGRTGGPPGIPPQVSTKSMTKHSSKDAKTDKKIENIQKELEEYKKRDKQQKLLDQQAEKDSYNNNYGTLQNKNQRQQDQVSNLVKQALEKPTTEKGMSQDEKNALKNSIG